MHILIGEVLQAVSLAVVIMSCEKSAEAIIAGRFLVLHGVEITTVEAKMAVTKERCKF